MSISTIRKGLKRGKATCHGQALDSGTVLLFFLVVVSYNDWVIDIMKSSEGVA